MKSKRFLLLLALPMLALAGCGKDGTEPQTPGTNDTGAIKFEIGFAGQDGTQTRVATGAGFNSEWEDGDKIGIFAVEHGQTLAASDNPIHNVPLTYNKAAGTWSGEAYWPGDGTKLDFFAYYPYSAEATDPTAITFTVSADQSGTTDSKRDYNLSDLLTAQSDNGGAGWTDGETVALSFTHMLAMVQFAIDEDADGIDFNEEMTVTLRGVKTAATLNISAGTTGEATADGDTSSVAMHRVPGTTDHIYRALVPAQTVPAETKLFHIENGGQTLTSTALTADLFLSLGEAELFTLSGTGGGETPDEDIDDVLAEIKDDNFRAAVTTLMTDEGWDANTDGKLSPAEAAAVTGAMDVSGEGITSLAGIEYFTALTELYCYGNALDALDVSKNTALTQLYCDGNALDALDVSNNTALTDLRCYGNALTTLDVSKNTALTTLNCSGNAIDALDVSANTALIELSCYANDLTALDVTKNTKLTTLYCFGNALTTLDVTKNAALTLLYCGDGSTELTVTVDAAHDISTDGNLKVYAGSTDTRITALDTPANGVTVTAGGTSGDPQTITPASLTGLTAPATGAAPTATVPETDEWTATPAWMVKVGVSSYFPFTDDAFAAETEYSVNITLTAKTGWQFAIDPGITGNTEKVGAWFEYMEDFVPAGGTLNGVNLDLNPPTTKTTVTIQVKFPATSAYNITIGGADDENENWED